MPKDKNLSIVIVNWNTKELISACLKSIKKNLPESLYEVWIVDNASSDKSIQMIKKHFGWVNLIANNENLGFAKANNQALRKIRSELVLILNPDTILTKGAIESMIDLLKSHKKIAGCGPSLLNPDGSVQHLGLYRKPPSLVQALLFYTDLYRIAIKIKPVVRMFWEANVESQRQIDVDQIPGACILARTKLIRGIGFFDEDYPFWFEDVDLCFKLRQKGYRLVYLPSAKITHLVGGSIDKWTDRAKKEARFFKSLFTFFDKNKQGYERVGIRLIIVLSQLFMLSSRTLMQLLRPNPKRASFIKLKLLILKNLLISQSLPNI